MKNKKGSWIPSCFLYNSDLLSISYNGRLFKPLRSVHVKQYWMIIFVSVNGRSKELTITDLTRCLTYIQILIISNTIQHTHQLKFSNLVVSYTITFRYMSKISPLCFRLLIYFFHIRKDFSWPTLQLKF